MSKPTAGLYDYKTGEYLRQASEQELVASIEAAKYDGGAGVIQDETGRSVYALEAQNEI